MSTKNKNLFFSFFLFLVFFTLPVQAAPGPIVVIVGTRPEAIKMIPVYQALKKANLPTVLCSTGQHAQLLDEIFTCFDIKPDFDLKVMKPGQDLFHVTTDVLNKTKEIFQQIAPSLVIVQGDTTSAMAAGLSAFYLKIPVAHVEAGLRTHDIYAPYPEEMNRQILGRIASFHFAPTPLAVSHLEKEGIKKELIYCTGNTVIDALFTVRDKIEQKSLLPSKELVKQVEALKNSGKKIVLLTAHRRESFNGGLQNIFSAIKTSLEKNPDLYVLYPMHPNPTIRQTLEQVSLQALPNMITMAPVTYQDMVYLLNAVDGVATDSGGIQEEAISLNKMTLVLRNETDRPEGLKDGLAQLVGTNQAAIIKGIQEVLQRDPKNISSSASPYGDGLASQRIVEILQKVL